MLERPKLSLFMVLNFGHSCLPAGRGAYLVFDAWNLVLLVFGLSYTLCQDRRKFPVKIRIL
jgi:hypothetical protein